MWLERCCGKSQVRIATPQPAPQTRLPPPEPLSLLCAHAVSSTEPAAAAYLDSLLQLLLTDVGEWTRPQGNLCVLLSVAALRWLPALAGSATAARAEALLEHTAQHHAKALRKVS